MSITTTNTQNKTNTTASYCENQIHTQDKHTPLSRLINFIKSTPTDDKRDKTNQPNQSAETKEEQRDISRSREKKKGKKTKDRKNGIASDSQSASIPLQIIKQTNKQVDTPIIHEKQNITKSITKSIALPQKQQSSVRDRQNQRTRRSINSEVERYYKTRLCPQFLDGFCERGARCTYAHGQNELRHTNLQIYFKTQECHRFQKGLCNKTEAECKYSHKILNNKQNQGNKRRQTSNLQHRSDRPKQSKRENQNNESKTKDYNQRNQLESNRRASTFPNPSNNHFSQNPYYPPQNYQYTDNKTLTPSQPQQKDKSVYYNPTSNPSYFNGQLNYANAMSYGSTPAVGKCVGYLNQNDNVVNSGFSGINGVGFAGNGYLPNHNFAYNYPCEPYNSFKFQTSNYTSKQEPSLNIDKTSKIQDTNPAKFDSQHKKVQNIFNPSFNHPQPQPTTQQRYQDISNCYKFQGYPNYYYPQMGYFPPPYPNFYDNYMGVQNQQMLKPPSAFGPPIGAAINGSFDHHASPRNQSFDAHRAHQIRNNKDALKKYTV